MPRERGPHLKIVPPHAWPWIPSRCPGKRCAYPPSTLDRYQSRPGHFPADPERQGIFAPEVLTPPHIRAFLMGRQRQGLSDRYGHGHARAVKAFLRFLRAEGIIPENPMERVTTPGGVWSSGWAHSIAGAGYGG